MELTKLNVFFSLVESPKFCCELHISSDLSLNLKIIKIVERNGFQHAINFKFDADEHYLISTDVYYFISLINHSCDSNAFLGLVDGKSILIVSKPIRAQQQITINYGVSWWKH